jgi:hypothetical protein
MSIRRALLPVVACSASVVLLLAGNALARSGAPSNVSFPSVSGQAQVGDLLVASTGSWTGSPTRYTYAWQDCNNRVRNCIPITAATAGLYTVAPGDIGHTIRVAVTAWNAYGSGSARSAPTAPVAAPAPVAPVKPANAALPVVSGTAQVGRSLSASSGSWTGTAPMTYGYQWEDCDSTGAACTVIGGASGSGYTLKSSDQGHTVRAVVTAANSVGSGSASSAQTAVVTAAPAPAGGLNGLHVSGNRFVDNNGNVVQLHGVNFSGPEYACVQGWGIFDGPSDQTMVSALKSWHVNIVRLPLNEDCWLNINGMTAAYAGANYQNAIVSFVNLLHQNGMYAELSLIWGAPGTYQATYQPGGPDEDHSPAFWASLAATFKNDQNVILAPWGETTTGWTCFLQTGCSNEATYGPSSAGYQTASMQQAVTVMRQAGYGGPIAIPCIDYANLCANYGGSSWLASRPSDPANQLVAEAHVYGKNTCDTTACFDADFAPLAAQVPLIFGETGESYDSSDCGSSYISTFMNWADAHGVGYEAWTWDTWGGCGVLINNFNGTPANAFGQWVHDHYVATFS